MLKGLGYLVSTLSVILLGIVAWSSASEKPAMAACLIIGMATSIVGMSMRWLSYRQEQREKQTMEQPRSNRVPDRIPASPRRTS